MGKEVKTMKYIKNTGRMSLAFTIVKDGREVKIELGRRLLYRDTGNIAFDGITKVSEEDIKLLKEQKLFVKFIESGDLEILEESQVRTPEETKVAKLEKENQELLEKLKKAEKADVKKMEEENKTLADENATLKAQLESLTKAKETKDPAETDENAEDKDASEVDTEGF